MSNRPIVELLTRASGQGTKWLAMTYGFSFPFYYVTEYPRSGGTWIAHMLADYLQIPLPKHSRLPIACSAVIHNHWKYSKKLLHPVYILRDGRDVAVSMMFYALRRIQKQRYYKKRFPSLRSADAATVADRFSQYLIEWFESPAGCRLSWPLHVREWVFQENVVCVRYEDFNRDSHSALKDLLTKLNIPDVDDDLVAMTASKFSFQRQTHRKVGQEDKRSNKRKGVVGDWRNYFNFESGQIFERYTNGLLVDLGYESDTEWVKGLHHEAKK